MFACHGFAFHYRSRPSTPMTSMRAFACFIAIITALTSVHGTVPIIVTGPAHQRAAVRLCSKASDQLRNGDIEGAKRDVDAALRIDPKLWPALFVRAQVYSSEGKYELAIQAVTKRSGNTRAAWKHRCCVPVSKCIFANTRTR